jgi:hypothetical protein
MKRTKTIGWSNERGGKGRNKGIEKRKDRDNKIVFTRTRNKMERNDEIRAEYKEREINMGERPEE